MEKLREHAKEIVKAQVHAMLQQKQIDVFLQMAAKFPYMSYENVFLLLYQMPEASLVCGRRAWKHLNTEIRNVERAIALFAPKLAENISADAAEGMFLYREIVGVYDISQTEHKNKEEIPKSELVSTERLLRERFDIIIFDDLDGTVIKNKLFQSLYSETEHILYVRTGIAESKRESEYLRLYIKLLVQKEAEKEVIRYSDEMERFLLNVIYRHFGLLYTSEECHRQSELYHAEEEEKRMFLEKLSKLTHRAAAELSGQNVLSFEETALCNIFFETERQEETVLRIGMAMELAAEKEIKGRLEEFMLLVRNMREEIYQKLYAIRMEQKLFSYPPVNIKE